MIRLRMDGGSKNESEASGYRAHLSPLADTRARPRLPARGRVGTANAGRSGRLPPAGAELCFGQLATFLSRRAHAVRDPGEARGAARLGRSGRRPWLQGADAPRPVASGYARYPRARLRRTALRLAVPTR